MNRVRLLPALLALVLLAGTAGPGHAEETPRASTDDQTLDSGSFPGQASALRSGVPLLQAAAVKNASGGPGGAGGVRAGRAAHANPAKPADERSRIAALQRTCLSYAADLAAARGGRTPYRGVAPPRPSHG